MRFTAADGITLLPHWTESWAPGNATIWVKVPSLPANGSTLLYLFYGNSAATSTSNGYTTFDLFDDFESAANPWNGEAGTSTFTRSTARAQRGAYSGYFEYLSGSGSTYHSKLQQLPNNFVQEWDMYDDLAGPSFKMVTGDLWGQRSSGRWSLDRTQIIYYSYHNTGYAYTPSSVARSSRLAQVWHSADRRFNGDLLCRQSANRFVQRSANNASRVTVEGISDAYSTYYVDDVRVRKYASPEPVAVLRRRSNTDQHAHRHAAPPNGDQHANCHTASTNGDQYTNRHTAATNRSRLRRRRQVHRPPRRCHRPQRYANAHGNVQHQPTLGCLVPA